jgi:23S rRNA pseudouridine1911/1915/1917 synthase
MYLREVVKSGGCEVNGRDENRGKRLRPNDLIEINLDLSKEYSMLPQEIPLNIIFEDNDIIVLNKPAGMLVHPSHAEKNGTLLNALSFYLNRNGGRNIRPGLIHRLDRETSGVIIVAKNARAHRILCLHFFRRIVKKKYVAMVDGIVKVDSGTIDAPIARSAEDKRWGVVEGGKPSETRFKVLETLKDHTILELEPITGRTNQLRIHCASIGHPIVGDRERHGSEGLRLCLHAATLEIRPVNGGNMMKFEAETPDFVASVITI